MRRVIPMSSHSEVVVHLDNGSHYVLSPRSFIATKDDGRQAWVNIWRTPRGFILTFDVGIALEGYFRTEDEAVEAWEKHAALLRSQEVA